MMKYKEIIPQRILNLESTGLKLNLLGEDEIFVKMHYFVESTWISNYGQMIIKKNDEYTLQSGEYVEGRLVYRKHKINVLQEGRWTVVESDCWADIMVVEAFIITTDALYDVCIWHKGKKFYDNYYKNLYPMNQMQYMMLATEFEKNGNDTEEIIEDICKKRIWKPRMSSEKVYKRTVRKNGYRGIFPFMHISFSKMIAYKKWVGMMYRVGRSERYKEVIVCEEWKSFAHFYLWFQRNYYKIPGEEMAIDKDILYKGNKVYSPETCIIVPQCINNYFVVKTKGKYSHRDLPIGVTRQGKKFKATVSRKNKSLNLGLFDTSEEAFAVYKKAKEEGARELAEEYNELSLIHI